MKSATLIQIKKKLETIAPNKLMSIMLTLIKSKTENKELISYLLFDEDDLSSYIADLRLDVSEMLKDIHLLAPYMIKRSMRKTLKFITRFSKYTGAKETEAELIIHFCNIMHEKGIHRNAPKVILNIYEKQLDKVEKLIPKLHPDLKTDYTDDIKRLRKL